jgi:hypothetical protein
MNRKDPAPGWFGPAEGGLLTGEGHIPGYLVEKGENYPLAEYCMGRFQQVTGAPYRAPLITQKQGNHAYALYKSRLIPGLIRFVRLMHPVNFIGNFLH